jgi:sialidase-1
MAINSMVLRPMFLAYLGIVAVGTVPSQAAEPWIKADVPLFVNDGQHKYRLPCLLATSQGTVLAACQKRIGQGDDFAPSRLVLRRSRDAGKTFEPEQTLFERNGYCTFNGNLIEEQHSRTLFACFISFPQAEGATWFLKTWIPRGGGFSVVKSTDDGKTWSKPIDIIPRPNAEGWHGGGAFNNNHGIQLQHGSHAGRLVIGARVFKRGVYEGRAKAGLLYSDDRGQTWHVGGVVLKNCGDIPGEVTVGTTPDGEVYVNCRNSLKRAKVNANRAEQPVVLPLGLVAQRRIYARSRDGGESFYEEGCHVELHDEPCNAGQTLYVPPGEKGLSLMLFTAPAGPKRTHLTGYVSRDGGRTWQAGNVISKTSGGYSDVTVLPDKTILSLYESRNGLFVARYNLDWLTLGKDKLKP